MKVYSNMKSFYLKNRRKFRVKEKRSDGVVDCANYTFRFFVLLRCVWIGKFESYFLFIKVTLEIRVCKFVFIIILEYFD